MIQFSTQLSRLTPDEDSNRLRGARGMPDVPEGTSDGRASAATAADPKLGRDAPRHHSPPNVLHFGGPALAARRGAVLNDERRICQEV